MSISCGVIWATMRSSAPTVCEWPRKGASILRPTCESGLTSPWRWISACVSSGSESTCPSPSCFTMGKLRGSFMLGRSKSRLTGRSPPVQICSSSTSVERPQTMPTSSTRSPGRGFSSSGSSSKMSSCAAAASATLAASGDGCPRGPSGSGFTASSSFFAITKGL